MVKEILIYGYIGYDWWTGDGITAKSIKAQLDEALATEGNVTVRINSPGGDVFEGIAIYNTLAAKSDRVEVIIEGIAYSMAAIIALSGGTIKMANNATMMIHNVSGGVWGNAQDIRGTLEMMEKLDNSLVISVAERTGLTSEKVKAQWFDYQDHTLTAEEAKAANLVDEVITMKKAAMPENIGALNSKEAFAWYVKNYEKPEATNLLTLIKNTIKEGITALSSNNSLPVVTETTPENSNDEPMKIKVTKGMAAMATALGITFKEGETEVEHELTAENFATVTAKLAEYENAATTAQNALAAEKSAHASTTEELNGLKETTEAAATEKPGDGGQDVVQAGTKETVKPVSATTQRVIDLQNKRNKTK